MIIDHIVVIFVQIKLRDTLRRQQEEREQKEKQQKDGNAKPLQPGEAALKRFL
jgi:hypothetical protein